VAKALGQLWATLSPEEKQVYQNKAAEERERLAKEIQAWKDAGGVVPEPSSASLRASTDSLIFPAARIRKIAKLDPEVKGLSKEALQLVCKASELFCSKLGKESVQTAQMQNRRKLLPDDVAQVCATREAFLFLRDDVRDLVQAQAVAAETTSAAAATTTTTKKTTTGSSATTGSKPLTSYFAPKSK
jgi:histone H3/H4